jgi:SM-20-related protein
MRIPFREFNAGAFSFARDPVLVLTEFWSQAELTQFRSAMSRGTWTTLQSMPDTARSFPECGNWRKGVIQPAEAQLFLNRLDLPCIPAHVESFPNIRGRHVNFAYFSYAAGDSLSLHDDTDQSYGLAPGAHSAARRLAIVAYLHETWRPDWGGELIIYADEPCKGTENGHPLKISHCIAPEPGALAIFTVPRWHRVARVDPSASEHHRLSIAGWVMTEH